jgi:hypothetical protein
MDRIIFTLLVENSAEIQRGIDFLVTLITNAFSSFVLSVLCIYLLPSFPPYSHQTVSTYFFFLKVRWV